MFGYLIYNREEKSINQVFIKNLIDAAKKRKITLCYKNKDELDLTTQKVMVDFAINRTRDFMLAKRLEERGIQVFNSSYTCQVGNDKLLCYQAMDILGERYLPLKSSELAFPYVCKSRAGHGGREVYMVTRQEELDLVRKKLKGKPYICQEIASELGKDLRVYMLGGQVVKAILRSSQDDFRSNYGLHGNAEVYSLSEKEAKRAKAIAEFIKGDYIGVDFLWHEGQWLFNEIEDVAGARMLYERTDLDIADLFLEYIKEVLNRTTK